jgi:rare lipoprotein A
MKKQLPKLKNKYLLYILFLAISFSIHAQQKVTASYYSHRFHGLKTSSGEAFDNHEFTAAHRTLPFGTLVRVTNLSNDKSVVVRVNDRLAPRGRHTIDITYAAAKEIDMIRLGVASVSITVLDSAEIQRLPLTENLYYKLQPSNFFRLPVNKHNTDPHKPLMLINIREKR